MPVLHIVNKSPSDRNSLDTCLRLAKAGAAILFIEDGVYAVQTNAQAAEKVQQAMVGKHIYALRPDLETRGVDSSHIIEGITLVDYDGFVRLTTEHDQLQSWL